MDDQLIILTEFDDALLGISRRCGKPPHAVYSREKCIQILEEDGLTREEAEEHFDFNIGGAWMGEGTPAFLESYEDFMENLGEDNEDIGI